MKDKFIEKQDDLRNRLNSKFKSIASSHGHSSGKRYSYQELKDFGSAEQAKWVANLQSEHQQEMIKKTVQESDVVLEGKYFHNFVAKQTWQHSLLEQVTDFANQSLDGDKNLLISGDYGCGKTHLCCAALNFLREGLVRDIRFTVLGKQWESIMDSLWSKDEKVRRKVRRMIENVDVLFIDEVGANEIAPMHQQLKELGRILRVRGNKNKATLLATNHKLESVPQILGEFVMGGLQEHGLRMVGINADFNANYNQRKPIKQVVIQG